MGRVFIKKLKIVLQSDIFYGILGILICFYLFVNIAIIKKTSVYTGNEREIVGIIKDYSFKESQLKLSIRTKEDLQVIYYINDENESNKLKEIIKFGGIVKLKGIMEKPLNNTIPNTFNYKKYLNNKDVFYIFNADSVESIKQSENVVYRIKNIFYDRVSKIDSNGYLRAFILGKKDELLFYNNYQSLGVAHLFAISGMHIGLFSGLILKVLEKVGEKKKYIIVNLFLFLYGFITGFGASVKRSLSYFLFSSLNKVFELKISILKLFFIAISLLIIIEPFVIFDVGFLYSVMTVFGIIICADFLKEENFFVKSLKTSVVAFLFSLPIALFYFYEINLLSIFYNIVYIPYVGFVVYPLSLLSFIFPLFSSLFNISVNLLEKISLLLMNIDYFVLRMSFNLLSVLIYYLFLVVFLKIKKKRCLLILFTIVFTNKYIEYFDSSTYVYFFDVGQGDSSLIITPYRNEVILIDTGGIIKYNANNDYYVSDNVITFLYSKGISKIDFLILSHGDFDHMGEVSNYINNFQVDNVIFNCGDFNVLEQNLIKILNDKKIPYCSCIKELNIYKNKLYFINNELYNNENDSSAVIYTEFNNYKFLFMGDAGIEVEEDLIKKYNLQNIEILKVGHHGSKTSSGKNFIDEINPKYSIISVGNNNRYGHPNNNVLDILEDSHIYRTDQDGSIMFKIKGNKLKIETWKS